MNALLFASPFEETGSGFQAAFWLFFSLFVAVCAVHLTFCYMSKSFWRKLTRPFCMVLLGAALAFLAPNYPLLYASCWVSAVGDLLLVNNKDPKYFLTGAAVFAAAHVLNAINQTKLLSYKFPDYAWAILAGVVLLAGFVGYFTREKDASVAVAAVCPAYACFHFVNIALALMVLIDGKFAARELMILLGYVVYVLSDLFVNYVTNKRGIKRGEFYTMLSYLIGQTLIYFGLATCLL